MRDTKGSLRLVWIMAEARPLAWTYGYMDCSYLNGVWCGRSSIFSLYSNSVLPLASDCGFEELVCAAEARQKASWPKLLEIWPVRILSSTITSCTELDICATTLNMAGFGEYPPNLLVKDALVVRQETTADHAVIPYTGEDLNRPRLGPANPFHDDSNQALKRKNVLTGHASETFISEHTFRAKHRAVERSGGPEREFQTNRQAKEHAAKIRATREGKGSATIADGDGAYVGPWARYKRPEYEEVEEAELGSDDEYEIVEEEEEEEEEVVPSGTLVKAPAESLARRKEIEARGEETTQYHPDEEYDYLGRTYMHVPQDLDVSLHKEVGSITNYIPKKVVHTWKHHSGKPVTALQLFPSSSHLGLSGSAEGTIKIWDVYRSKELLRTYSGHTKAITDLSFNLSGKQFLSGGFDRWIKLWDTETGKCINRFNSGKTPHVIKFNPSSDQSHEFLAGLSDNRILQYDSRAGNEVVQEYDHHLGAINTIEFVDESRRFMTTSDDRSLRVWEYGIPVEIKTIRYVVSFRVDVLRLTSTANPTCLPSQNPPSIRAASMFYTNAATTPSLHTRQHQISLSRTERSCGGGTTQREQRSVLHAVLTASLWYQETQQVTFASGISRLARCTTSSWPIRAGGLSTAWRGRSRRQARCLQLERREISRCGIRRGISITVYFYQDGRILKIETVGGQMLLPTPRPACEQRMMISPA